MDDISMKTSIVKKTLDPEWNERFEIPVKNLQRIGFVVKDHDVIGKNTELGYANVTHAEEKFCRWPKQMELKMRKGHLSVVIAFGGPEDWVFDAYKGTLALEVEEAAQLYDANSVSQQSPYAVLKLNEEETKTNVHAKGGVAPKWHQKFSLKVDGSRELQKLNITIKEKGVMSDTVIGEVDLPLQVIIGGEQTRWWPVRRKGGVKGELKLKADFKGNGGFPKADKLDEKDVGLLSVKYGADDYWVDCTSVFSKAVKFGKLTILKDTDVDFLCGCDPAPQAQKKLVLEYFLDRKKTKKEILVSERKGSRVTSKGGIFVQHVVPETCVIKGLGGTKFRNRSVSEGGSSSEATKTKPGDTDPRVFLIPLAVLMIAYLYNKIFG
eukprot:CAMPEP_0167756954 /NCGR_PEP_ID=MMETSP0110_2-20121227/9665_1 /TAXON_ID=629695 /ORGANISM="Gymnochlora sp., Strain CCMP2014" /LENGTH=379 /DNA_ID=CAMNT_0007643107 /DNA_START=130 /DNA_END=1269 /DNA_ORIENTATION=-